MGGIWAQVEIRHDYDEEVKGKRSPFWIDSMKPIQAERKLIDNDPAQ